MTKSPGFRAVLRIAFWGYAALLFTGTHWPRLVAPGPEGTDKWIHMACFGTWTLLLAAARIFGPGLAWRNILICVLVSAAYAAVDESLQAIPFIHRSAEFADYFANLKGIGMAGILLALIRLTVGRSGQGEDGPGT